MAKSKKIASIATVVTAFAVMCTAGVTLAFDSSVNRSRGSLTTADLNLSATAKNVKVYSAVKASDYSNGDEGIFFDENGSAYRYQQSVVQGDVSEIGFPNHDGGVAFDDKSVTVTNFMPGDKVEFDIEVTSTSTVSFDYRAELYVDATEGQTLLNQLDFSAGELGLLRKDISGADTDKDKLAPAVLTDYTEWNAVGANKPDVETVKVTVSLPITAKEGQGETVKFYYVASGVQNTELQEDVAQIETGDGKTVNFKKLADAVAYAQESGVSEISVTGSTVLEEGTIYIDNALKFTGVPDANGNYPELKGARIVIRNGSAASFNEIVFRGDSYIDVTRAAALIMTDCDALVNPSNYYDAASRDFLDEAAFIVSGTSLTAVNLNVTGGNITGSGAAVNLRAPLNTGSVISGVTLGSDEGALGGEAAVILNGAYDVDGEEPVVSFKDNVIYAKRALSLGGSGSYTVISGGNTAYGLESGVFAGGTSCVAAFMDSGSKIGETALQCANVADSGLLFGAVDVQLNAINRITAGKIAVNQKLSMVEFYANYAVGGTLAHNAIALYSNGVHYAYLNAANNDNGFVIDEI